MPEVKEQNEEIALDFAGPFQNARKGKKVSIGVDRPFFGMAGRKISKVSHYEKSYRISEAIHSVLWGA